MRNQNRFDDPALDLIEHARQVVRGTATLSLEARREMIAAVGIKPSPTVSDAVVARNFLAARGQRL